jgi:hypothetical protein
VIRTLPPDSISSKLRVIAAFNPHGLDAGWHLVVRHERLAEIALCELTGDLLEVRANRVAVRHVCRIVHLHLDERARCRQPEMMCGRILIESHRSGAALLHLCIFFHLREVRSCDMPGGIAGCCAVATAAMNITASNDIPTNTLFMIGSS